MSRSSPHLTVIPHHINLALDNGLSQAEASEVPSHLARYAGWPSIFAALPTAQDVLESRIE